MKKISISAPRAAAKCRPLRAGEGVFSHASGFTLIELMLVLAIAAIILVTAGPAYQEFMRNQRADSAASDLALALREARSEAIKSNNTVSVCTANSARSACANGNWEDGWLVIRTNPTGTTPATTVLSDNNPKTNGVAILPSATTPTEIQFNRLGAVASGDASLLVCSGGGGSGKLISVLASGQIRSVRVPDPNAGRACP